MIDGFVYFGDCLNILPQFSNESIDLIYIDPPFNTGVDRVYNKIQLNKGDKTRIGFGGKIYKYETVSTKTYKDNFDKNQYLEFIKKCIIESHRLLKNTGSIFLHIGQLVSHRVRILLDEVFGEDNFINEIVWAYDFGGRSRNRFPRKHDLIYWYSKTKNYKFFREQIDRLPYMAPGLVSPEKREKGKLPTDVWWLTIVPTNSKERTGYPTQKPEKLLERIIKATTAEGDLVMDFFAGSGTTGYVAGKLNRNFILIDNNPQAVEIIKNRLSQLNNINIKYY